MIQEILNLFGHYFLEIIGMILIIYGVYRIYLWVTTHGQKDLNTKETSNNNENRSYERRLLKTEDENRRISN